MCCCCGHMIILKISCCMPLHVAITREPSLRQNLHKNGSPKLLVVDILYLEICRRRRVGACSLRPPPGSPAQTLGLDISDTEISVFGSGLFFCLNPDPTYKTKANRSRILFKIEIRRREHLILINCLSCTLYNTQITHVPHSSLIFTYISRNASRNVFLQSGAISGEKPENLPLLAIAQQLVYLG